MKKEIREKLENLEHRISRLENPSKFKRDDYVYYRDYGINKERFTQHSMPKFEIRAKILDSVYDEGHEWYYEIEFEGKRKLVNELHLFNEKYVQQD